MSRRYKGWRTCDRGRDRSRHSAQWSRHAARVSAWSNQQAILSLAVSLDSIPTGSNRATMLSCLAAFQTAVDVELKITWLKDVRTRQRQPGVFVQWMYELWCDKNDEFLFLSRDIVGVEQPSEARQVAKSRNSRSISL